MDEVEIGSGDRHAGPRFDHVARDPVAAGQRDVAEVTGRGDLERVVLHRQELGRNRRQEPHAELPCRDQGLDVSARIAEVVLGLEAHLARQAVDLHVHLRDRDASGVLAARAQLEAGRQDQVGRREVGRDRDRARGGVGVGLAGRRGRADVVGAGREEERVGAAGIGVVAGRVELGPGAGDPGVQVGVGNREETCVGDRAVDVEARGNHERARVLVGAQVDRDQLLGHELRPRRRHERYVPHRRVHDRSVVAVHVGVIALDVDRRIAGGGIEEVEIHVEHARARRVDHAPAQVVPA